MTEISNKKVLEPNNLVDRFYWDELWSSSVHRSINLNSYYHYRLDKLFKKFIHPNSKVLEIGCGGSQWLPYFVKKYKAEVWGIDYSLNGVEVAIQNLNSQSVKGKIILGDLFNNKSIPNKYFDVVWSYGFIEHFKDPKKVIAKVSQFLNLSGIVITLVPNLRGFIGWLHRIVDGDLYRKHVVITPQMLDKVHMDTGLVAESPASYLGIFSIGVVNFNKVRKFIPNTIDSLLWSSIQIGQQMVCLPFRLLEIEPESKLFSPYIIGAYRRLSN